MLEALSGSPVTSLTMSGGVPLSGAIASAVASCLPNLKGLALVFRWEENDLPHGDPNAEPASQYFYGAMQLLTLCGPRLRELGLVGGVRHWPGMTFQALRCCTALTLLEVEAGRLDGDGGQQHGPHLGGLACIQWKAARLSRWVGSTAPNAQGHVALLSHRRRHHCRRLADSSS